MAVTTPKNPITPPQQPQVPPKTTTSRTTATKQTTSTANQVFKDIMSNLGSTPPTKKSLRDKLTKR